MTSIQVDPKSAWALGEFRESLIELRLIDQHHQRLVRARGIDEDGAGEEGGIREEEASLIAYQGENLAGRLVVKLEDAGEPGTGNSPVEVRSTVLYDTHRERLHTYGLEEHRYGLEEHRYIS